MSTIKSKTEKVLDHLKEKGSITSWDAIKLYKATRLSSIIYNLRKRLNAQGDFDIDSIPTKGKNGTTYATYNLVKTIKIKKK
mgnify:FL=1